MKYQAKREWPGITLYHADCLEMLPIEADAVITDPPYGINQDRGMGGGGYDGFGNGNKRTPKTYAGGWDGERPDALSFALVLGSAPIQIIWGGNYFADLLPQSRKWLVWDKVQTMPTYSDCELAWTNLPGASVKMIRYAGAGLMAKEQDRVHPTQKPVRLIEWCIDRSAVPIGGGHLRSLHGLRHDRHCLHSHGPKVHRHREGRPLLPDRLRPNRARAGARPVV